MWRDVQELASSDVVGRTGLLLIIGLPVIAALLLARGHRRALLSLALWTVTIIIWLVYYLARLSVGAATGFWLMVLLMLAAWASLIPAIRRSPRG